MNKSGHGQVGWSAFARTLASKGESEVQQEQQQKEEEQEEEEVEEKQQEEEEEKSHSNLFSRFFSFPRNFRHSFTIFPPAIPVGNFPLCPPT